MICNLEELVPFLRKNRNLKALEITKVGNQPQEIWDLGIKVGRSEIIEELIKLLGGEEELLG